MSALHSKWVKLNVGGQLFQTTLTSLLSCPNSMLANMFDPDSPLKPGYSENGVYFLDVNPKYFSVILDWLMHKKVMSDSDTNMSNVAEVAKYFGLQELVEELKMIEAVVVLSDEGKAAEFHGHFMGLFLKETDGIFYQAGGDIFLYQGPKGDWYINDNIHEENCWLTNSTWRESYIQSNIIPRHGWEFVNDAIDEFVMDEKLKIKDASKMKLCNRITLSSAKYSQKEFLGEFQRVPETWRNGWPVFKNKNGKKLEVSNDPIAWCVYNDSAENFLSSGRVTSCPAHSVSGTSERYGYEFWQYWKDDDYGGSWIEDETFNIKCDVHG